jgi:hypothetical protein
MPADAAPAPGAASFIVLEGDGVDWCFDIEHVREIVLEADWPSDSAIDLSAWWGSPSVPPGRSCRLLLLQTSAGVRAVRSAGISQRTVARDRILPVPRFVARGDAGRAIAGIVFSESQKPLVLIHADAIAEMGSIHA